MELIIDASIVALLGYCIYTIHQVADKLEERQSTQTEEQEDYSDVKEHLSAYEIERLEREEEFDKRIEMLKEQLAHQQKFVHKSADADELHPLVKNLPHNIIPERNTEPPDVEYTD